MPKVQDENPDYDRCQLSTKKMQLVALGGLFEGCAGAGEGAAVLCLTTALYSTTTAIVSGSIVLVGNSLHWLEKQGKCEEGLLKAAIEARNRALVDNSMISSDFDY